MFYIYQTGSNNECPLLLLRTRPVNKEGKLTLASPVT